MASILEINVKSRRPVMRIVRLPTYLFFVVGRRYCSLDLWKVIERDRVEGLESAASPSDIDIAFITPRCSRRHA